MLALGLDDKLPHFRIDLDRLDDAVDLVAATTRKNYPTLDVPFHSRWRHFVANGDRSLAEDRCSDRLADPVARARAEFDLAIVSVLLDAGAGPQWRYRDPATGAAIGRSEGLALASLAMFARGVFFVARMRDRSSLARRCRTSWRNLDTATLRKGFQVTDRQSAGRP